MTKSVSQIIHEAIQDEVNSFLEEHTNPNYLLHNSDWTEMIQWAVKQEWWIWFLMDYFRDNAKDEGDDLVSSLVKLFADPPALATKIVEYLESKEIEK